MKSIAWALVFSALIVDANWETMNAKVRTEGEVIASGFLQFFAFVMVAITTIVSN